MPEPSPWLDNYNPQIRPNNTAGFVEYLRWMRLPDDNDELDNALKTKILQEAAQKSSGYKQYYQTRDRYFDEILANAREKTPWLTEDNSVLAVRCDWRVRVGGQRGPESILLPAFDAVGMPYFPSSALRGVARAAAVRERWEAAIASRSEESRGQEVIQLRQQIEREIASYFGALDVAEEHQAGKVIFLDAYPTGKQWRSNLEVDMANNIWKWEGGELNYQSNPNTFLSLKDVAFRIGLCPTVRCSQANFLQVRQWLIEGLQEGLGSQINSGYGAVNIKKKTSSKSQPFCRISFRLEGQLIHSYQHQTWNPNAGQHGRFDGEAKPEVRPIAFKSMLRYWFRALSLGFVSPAAVQAQWEPMLFGGIDPQTQGVLRFTIVNGRSPKTRVQAQNAGCLQQSGTLCIEFSPEARSLSSIQRNAIKHLMEHLTWLMFHLGGVGQGARRPLYQRPTRPYYRGVTLEATQGFSTSPPPVTLGNWHTRFHNEFQGLYQQLSQLTGITPLPIQSLALYNGRLPTHEVLRRNCWIVLCGGNSIGNKCFSLGLLHREAFLGASDSGRNLYDSELCGDSQQNPSPIWIKKLDDNYQVVTIFNCTSKRRNFLNTLQTQASPNYQEIWSDRGLV
ncbi:MAG: RAMP superfamily CRISPR-associated protein [Cyanobacteria bacterium P01_E01_bin.42]